MKSENRDNKLAGFLVCIERETRGLFKRDLEGKSMIIQLIVFSVNRHPGDNF
ncbi:hypothetical protein M595_0436 [Lyngbya aestuarii BL J]|uniref:Uncharacterized protein n=1 Tax=Lyngbya aestuarii BL J TaxID=1348334 RepID=U7QP05_9CYAN|nr:hypothetical protein M595_0436 [Lyngbya aestuarii BL J]